MLREYRDHCLRFLSLSQKTVDRVRTNKRDAMWRAALRQASLRIGP